MASDDDPIIRYIPPTDAPAWPIEARTLDEALEILRRPGRFLTREELELLYPSVPPTA